MRVRSGEPQPDGGSAEGGATLLERDGEQTQIANALDRACAGTGSLIVVEGPAGIGKTSLVRAAIAMAADREMTLLRARGSLLERGLEYGIVRQLAERVLLDADRERRERLLAGPAAPAAAVLGGGVTLPDRGPGVDPAGDILHGLHWLIANLAEERPVLLAIDDAHWGDPASLRAGAYLAHRLEGMPAVMLVGIRDDEPGPEAAATRQMLAASTPIYLRPELLSRSAAERVLALSLAEDSPSPELVDACLRASGGNPFFLTELALDLGRRGADAGAIPLQAVDNAGPVVVRRSILLRLGQLGEGSRRLAESVALLGGEAELRVAAELAGLDPDTGAEVADTLAGAGIFDRSHPLRIKHPLVRAAIDAEIGPAERSRVHRRAFEILSRSGADEQALIAHALPAEARGDPELVALLRRAGSRALGTGSPLAAAIYLRRALEERAPEPDPGALLAELGRAEARGGEFERGLARIEGALEVLSDPDLRIAAHRDRAFTVFTTRGMAEAREVVVATIAELGTEDSGGEGRLQLEADLAMLAWLSGGEHELDLDRHRGVKGATRAERTVLALLSQQDLCAGNDPDSAVELAQRALGGGRLIASDTSESLAWYLATYALLAVEALDPARVTIEEAIADGSRRGSAFARAGALGCRAMLALNEGRPRDAEADARTAAEGGLPPTMVLANSSYIVMSLVDQGELDEAAAEVRAGGFEHGPGGPTVLRFAPWARARLNEARGDADAVRTDLQPLADDEKSGMPMRALAWRALLARSLAGSGEQAQAAELAAGHLDWARAWGRPAALGIAQRAVALSATGKERAELLAEAVETLAGSSLRPEEARARAELGVALLRGGRRRDGRAALELALEAAEGCDARALADSVASELRVAGASPRRLSFDQMTASERRVAELAAAGKTNRQIAEELFVTPKTVENHLTRCYAKLGVHSRRELAGAL